MVRLGLATVTDLPVLQALLEASQQPLVDWPTRYRDQQALGYLCSYAPLEVVQAAGLTPVRVRTIHTTLRRADSLVQSYACAVCRSALEQALGGELDFLRGVLFAHTCDPMQALADLWRMHTPGEFYVDCTMHPANLGSSAAQAYLNAELHRIRDGLALLTGRAIRDDDLGASIALFNQTRRLVQTLHRHRRQLTASQFYAIVDAAHSMPRQRFNSLLAGALSELGAIPLDHFGPRVVLVGAVQDEPGLLEILDDLRVQVAADDLCSGMRPFLGRVAEDVEPMEALTEYYLQRPPCPTKLTPDYDAASELLGLVRSTGAHGVLFVLHKYCDPHAFERARILPALDRAGVPHLLLELELTPNLEGLRTRLQAFVEIL